MFSYSLSKRIFLNPAAPKVSCVSLKSPSSFWPNSSFTFSKPPSGAFICIFSVFTALLPAVLISRLIFCQSLLTNLDDLPLSLRANVSGAHLQTLTAYLAIKANGAGTKMLGGICWVDFVGNFHLIIINAATLNQHLHAKTHMYNVYQFACNAVVYSTYPQICRHISGN